MNRIDRLLGILTHLQSKKYVPAEKLAEKFKISIRTVYRDVKALNEQGIPVSFEQTRGYFIVPGYFLPPVSFTSDEANAMLLMESVVAAFTDRSIQQQYSSALNKIKSVLHSTQKDKLETLDSKIRHQLPSCFQNDYEYLSLIQNAISSRTVLLFDYKSSGNEISQRRVEPIGLIFYALSWHVIGWCHLRNDYRDFKVARILTIRNTTQSFTKNDHIEVADYMKLLPVSF